ncbi:hypothetical protein ACJJTC_002429 [Scirpophaga incertulas]
MNTGWHCVTRCSQSSTRFSTAVHGNTESITQDKNKTANKSIQVYIIHKFRSKAAPTVVNIIKQMTSPLKPDRQSVSTSPFKIKRCTSQIKQTTSNIYKSSRKIFVSENHSEFIFILSDILYTPSITHGELSPTISVQTKSSSDCTELIQDDKQKESTQMLQCTLLRIYRNPGAYIGVTKECYYLIDLIDKIQTFLQFIYSCV